LIEPYFFNTDDEPRLYTLDRYEDLFRGAHEQHIAIGEASTFYLSSSNAVTNIIRYQPDARFIVMVRNLVEMAQSYHAEMVLRGAESVEDFFAAWSLQKDRPDDGRSRFPVRNSARASRWKIAAVDLIFFSRSNTVSG
jgi:hypothetical protein